MKSNCEKIAYTEFVIKLQIMKENYTSLIRGKKVEVSKCLLNILFDCPDLSLKNHLKNLLNYSHKKKRLILPEF